MYLKYGLLFVITKVGYNLPFFAIKRKKNVELARRVDGTE